jgi:hypothetical protein
MPGSKSNASIVSAGRAALYLVILVSILWGSANTIATSKSVLRLYQHSLGSIPAYLYLSALSDTLDHGPNQVLLVGPSTVREGFDAALMSQIAPGLKFINAGVTSPGTMPHAELLVDILHWYGVDIGHLVLGLNSRMLASRFSPIAATRYVDAMDYREGFYYLDFETPQGRGAALQELDRNRIWPMRRIRIRLDYLIRWSVYNVNRWLKAENALPRKAFERTDDRLENQSGFLYSDQRHQPALLQEHLRSMASMGLMAPNRYHGVAQIESMRRTLRKAMEVAPRVTVVVMPEHSSVRSSFGSYGDRFFFQVLDEFQGENMSVIDRRAALSDELIRDIAHLVPDGREILSRSIASALVQ